MKTLAELIADSEAMLAAMEEIVGKMDSTDAAGKEALEAEYKAKSASYDTLQEQIARRQAQEERAAQVAKQKAAIATDTAGKNLTPKGDKAPAEAKDHVKHLWELEQGFADYLCGKALLPGLRAELSPKSPKFSKGAGGVVIPPHLVAAMFGKSFAAKAGIFPSSKTLVSEAAADVETGETSASQLVPTQVLTPKLLELPPEPADILGRVTVVPAPFGRISWPRLVQTDSNEYGGVVVEWIDEGSAKPEEEPTFTHIEILTHEVAAYTEISHTLLRRSVIDLEQVLARLYRGGVQNAIETAILNGTGTGQPLGVIVDAAIRTQARAAAGAVGYADLVNLKHNIRPYHRANAMFVMGDDVEQGLELTVDTLGRPIFTASTMNGVYDRLVGYPYSVNTRCPALGSRGDVVYGDWSEYILATEQEIVIKRSDDYRFRNNIAAFLVYAVIGGRAGQPRAFVVLLDGSGS